LAGLHFRAAFIFLGLFGLAVTMLFPVCHGRALQRFRRRDTVSYRSNFQLPTFWVERQRLPDRHQS
jgi:hypothetical protein